MVVAGDAPAKNGAPTETDAGGVSIRLYRSYGKWPQPLRMLTSFCSAVRLYRRVNSAFRPDVLIARHHFNVLAAWAAGLRNIRYLVPGTVRMQNSSLNLSRSQTAAGAIALWANAVLQRFALAASSEVLVFSRGMAGQVSSIYPKATIRIVVPGVDTSRFALREPAGAADGKVELLYVGRLVAAKGVRYAIEALQYLPAPFKLTIVGDGEDRIALEQVARRLGVDARVNFAGETAVPEESYRRAHIYLMPSTYEPFGQSIIEAGACGLPVIAFAQTAAVQTATHEILGDLAVYAADVSGRGLAEAVERAYRAFYIDKSMSGAAVARHITAKYSWARLYEALTDAP